jgi:hypothetical protein
MWTQAVTSIEKVTDKFEPGKSQNVNHNSATNPAPRLAGAEEYLPPVSAPLSGATASSVELIGDHHWRVTLVSSIDWFYTSIPVVPLETLTIRPAQQASFADDAGRWAALIGDKIFDTSQPADTSREARIDIPENPGYLHAPSWLSVLRVRMDRYTEPSFSLDIRTQYQPLPGQQVTHGQYQSPYFIGPAEQLRSARATAEHLIRSKWGSQ